MKNKNKNTRKKEDSAEDQGNQSPARKKPKKIDAMEERFLHHRRKFNFHDSSCDGEDEDEDEDDEEKDKFSMLDDVIYGEKVEPEFDLMKSMLRASYSKKSKNVEEEEEEEKNLELEVGENHKKIDMVEGGGERVAEKRELKVSGSNRIEVKGKEGPRFRDLGGMEVISEELKMEVIVPLYHPQLPRWLGERLMAGILLHGPPGCGKTKLAHAIANETGVSFYQISATEVVSGVSGINFS